MPITALLSNSHSPARRAPAGRDGAFAAATSTLASACRSRSQRLRHDLGCMLASLLTVLATGAVVAQDGMPSLPPDAREAGTAYRKLIAADGGAAKMSVAERRNYEESEPPKSRCSEAARQFCSDLANAQFEFKPFKALLPDVPKLTPHNVYIRRNKITVAYTFK